MTDSSKKHKAETDAAGSQEKKHKKDETETKVSFKGSCYCGNVAWVVTGKPTLSGYCHCSLCRRFQGAPFVHFLAFNASDFKFTKGEKEQSKGESVQSHRQFCTKCGSPTVAVPKTGDITSYCTQYSLMEFAGEHPTAVPAGFEPTMHLWYGNKLKHLSIKDGLPKYKSMPKEFGGDGEVLAD